MTRTLTVHVARRAGRTPQAVMDRLAGGLSAAGLPRE